MSFQTCWRARATPCTPPDFAGPASVGPVTPLPPVQAFSQKAHVVRVRSGIDPSDSGLSLARVMRPPALIFDLIFVPAGGIWDLVRKTQQHPLYATKYSSLPSYLRGWERVPRDQVKKDKKGAAVGEPVQVVGIDCEMGATMVRQCTMHQHQHQHHVPMCVSSCLGGRRKEKRHTASRHVSHKLISFSN